MGCVPESSVKLLWTEDGVSVNPSLAGDGPIGRTMFRLMGRNPRLWGKRPMKSLV